MQEVWELNKPDLLALFQKMAFMAEAKEWDNRSHTDRVRHYVMLLATKAGLPFQEAEQLAIASVLHDIGKGLLPEALMNKKGQYSPTEWKTVEQHTINGKKLLEGNAAFVLQSAEAIAYTHHERWDGSGYPQGLGKNDIPFAARTCALADVFDALTTPRSYKQAISEDEARELIKEASGKLFDPKLVEIFLDSPKVFSLIKQRNP